MRVLLYSAVLYLFGIAIVLYLRPALMFKHNGQWKEFGVQGVDTTYFPFWLFCILWAVLAHGLIRLVYSDADVSVVKSAAAMASLTARIHDSSTAASLPPPPISDASGVEATEEAAPGYYKLDRALMKKKGVPRYIYVGEEKPSDLEEI
jgi:hypothetical protein